MSLSQSPSGDQQQAPPPWRPILALTGPAANALAGSGSGRVAVPVPGTVHLFVDHADRSPAAHLTVDPAGTVAQRAEVALASVTGVAHDSEYLAVAGAGFGSDRPTICMLDGSGRSVAIDIQTSAGTQQTNVAAWPLLAESDGLWVVWADGRDPATIRLAVVQERRIVPVDATIQTKIVLSLQVSPASGGGVEVLWQGIDGMSLCRATSRGVAPTALGSQALSSSATLAAGSVVTPMPDHRVEIRDTSTGSARVIDLPPPPEGQNAQIDWVTLAPAMPGPGPLVWSTRTGPEHAGGSGELTAASRTWVAAARPPTWHPEVVRELPGGARCVVGLDGQVLAFPPGGGFLGWMGTLS